jgi:hypothetical protein
VFLAEYRENESSLQGFIRVASIMHLSIVSPTTPCTGRGGGIGGDLLDLTSKTPPRGGVFDAP